MTGRHYASPSARRPAGNSQSQIRLRIVADDEDAPAVAEVVDIVDKPVGLVVHLHIVPGLLEDYQAVIQRAVIPA
jgi:hypothetical protein